MTVNGVFGAGDAGADGGFGARDQAHDPADRRDHAHDGKGENHEKRLQREVDQVAEEFFHAPTLAVGKNGTLRLEENTPTWHPSTP
jgi:hypothetical protein